MTKLDDRIRFEGRRATPRSTALKEVMARVSRRRRRQKVTAIVVGLGIFAASAFGLVSAFSGRDGRVTPAAVAIQHELSGLRAQLIAAQDEARNLSRRDTELSNRQQEIYNTGLSTSRPRWAKRQINRIGLERRQLSLQANAMAAKITSLRREIETLTGKLDRVITVAS